MKTISMLIVLLSLHSAAFAQDGLFVYGRTGPVEVEAIREEPKWYIPQSGQARPAYEKMAVTRWEYRNRLEREYLNGLGHVGSDVVIPKPGKPGDLRPVYEKVKSREWDRRNLLELKAKGAIASKPIVLQEEAGPRLIGKPQIVEREPMTVETSLTGKPWADAKTKR